MSIKQKIVVRAAKDHHSVSTELKPEIAKVEEAKKSIEGPKSAQFKKMMKKQSDRKIKPLPKTKK